MLRASLAEEPLDCQYSLKRLRVVGGELEPVPPIILRRLKPDTVEECEVQCIGVVLAPSVTLPDQPRTCVDIFMCVRACMQESVRALGMGMR
jgi:hypothetical protein